jgi:GWxTD domain-containing protein
MLRSKRWWAVCMLFMLCPLFSGGIQAQVEFASDEENKGPDFHFDLIGTALNAGSPMSRLNIYLEVVYDDLQFVKMADDFEASYEVTVTIYDNDGEQVDGKIWKESVNAASFDATNKRTRYSQSHRTFDLDPGKYKVAVSVQDVETRNATERTRSVELANYSASTLSMSDIIFLSEIDFDSTGVRSIRPQVSGPSKGIVDSTLAYFEVYQSDSSAAAVTEYEIFGVSSKKRLKRSFAYQVAGWRNPVYFSLHADSLAHDTYKLKITTSIKDKKVTEEKDFYVRWSALPSSAADLNTAIDQARYVANKEEWKRLNKAKGDARMEEFKAFWNRHDPTPGTEANESMDAHYARVEFANRNFTVMHRPGWRTDMGIIYIILGPPDDIERNAYPRYSKPYEVWNYYRYSRQFLFLDMTGFGDYRLDTPMSIYEFQRLLTN